MVSATPSRYFVLLALLTTAFVTMAVSAVPASEFFLEAESFTSSGGWTVQSGPEAKSASGLAVLSGAGGAKDGVATATVKIKDAGQYRIWVRYSSHPKWRGPFHVTALAGGRELGDGLFDAAFEGKSARDVQSWRSFEAVLPEGEVTLRFRKHENRNAAGPACRVDCLLLTMDEKLVPNHLHYGAQTFLRITLGDGHDKPVYIHVFADHFHAPWYQHYSLAREGAVAGVVPRKKEHLLTSGERTAWCNITPMIFQDSGAMLYMTARHSYTEHAERLCATFEFATAADEGAIVRTLKVDNQPGGIAVFTPPNLLTPENLALLKTDREIAEETGKLADAFPWPAHGKRMDRFPFLVSAREAGAGLTIDRAVEARENKTLAYFGFTPKHLRTIHGAWFMIDGSYCRPDVEKMKKTFATAAAEFKQAGGDVRKIVFCRLTDEPTGQSLEFAAHDAAYADRFRAWLKQLGKTPADLLVNDWDAVKIVTAAEREKLPALYYYSQRFRTRALGDFMAIQARLAQEAYGGTFPVQANFSDGAVYLANFYGQGVDYFELLDSPDQNAVWSEDWSNGASTYQCAAFNIDLMRAAARERGQVVGNFVIAHANRKPWDIKLKATSELARGSKTLESFCYGPRWATHEGGPYWRTHVWQARPETWDANASLTREVGAVEDVLLTAMPVPAKVALLYSSATDIWTAEGNLAWGFDRMHTWLALAHAQMPVDVLSEGQAAQGMLDGYQVCYLSGPNLMLSAAEKLKAWVEAGGTLWLTADAASRDEFNRPLHVLDPILPADRAQVQELQKVGAAGRNLAGLSAKDEVRWPGGKADVLAVRQSLAARAGVTTLATFGDKSPAAVQGKAGRGTICCVGFLPSLGYIKQALDARNELQRKATEGSSLAAAEQKEVAILERSANPWKYPADLREFILSPVRAAGVASPITCDVPLVDAVVMHGDVGIMIPLANYTLEPIERLTLQVSVPRRVVKAESARRGGIAFRQGSSGTVELAMPLENNDFVKLYLQ